MRAGRGYKTRSGYRPTPAPRRIGGAMARVESTSVSVRIARNAPRTSRPSID